LLAIHCLVLDIQFFSGAKSRAAASWVGRLLVGARSKRFPGQYLQPRLLAAATLGQTRGALATFCLLPNKRLDLPVFQGMEGNDPEAAAVPKRRHSLRQGIVQGLQFVIDRHAKGLKHACSGVNSRGPGGPRNGLGNQIGQVSRAGNGAAATDVYNGPGNTAGPAFLAEGAEDGSQLLTGCAIDQGTGGGFLLHIHAHVKRPIVPETETAGRGVQLMRRYAEVEQNAINPWVAAILQYPSKVTEISVPRQ
jgi:hypothetical protein